MPSGKIVQENLLPWILRLTNHQATDIYEEVGASMTIHWFLKWTLMNLQVTKWGLWGASGINGDSILWPQNSDIWLVHISSLWQKTRSHQIQSYTIYLALAHTDKNLNQVHLYIVTSIPTIVFYLFMLINLQWPAFCFKATCPFGHTKENIYISSWWHLQYLPQASRHVLSYTALCVKFCSTMDYWHFWRNIHTLQCIRCQHYALFFTDI